MSEASEMQFHSGENERERLLARGDKAEMEASSLKGEIRSCIAPETLRLAKEALARPPMTPEQELVSIADVGTDKDPMTRYDAQFYSAPGKT